MRLKQLLVVGVVAVAGEILAGNALSTENGRVWQAVADESAPLAWRWDKHAASATVAVSNLLTGAAGETPVARTAGAASGSVAMPKPSALSAEGEALVDVTIVQFDSESVATSTNAARLAFLSPNAVAEGGRAKFAAGNSPRVVSYDRLWAVSSMGATSASCVTSAGGAATATALSGVSGYFPLAAFTGGVKLQFDGEDVWAATVRTRAGAAVVIR